MNEAVAIACSIVLPLLGFAVSWGVMREKQRANDEQRSAFNKETREERAKDREHIATLVEKLSGLQNNLTDARARIDSVVTDNARLESRQAKDNEEVRSRLTRIEDQMRAGLDGINGRLDKIIQQGGK